MEIQVRKIQGRFFVRPHGENILLYFTDNCGHFSWFAEIRVEKCKEKFQKVLDFLLDQQ